MKTITGFEIPEGFSHLMWDYLVDGQEVFICGTKRIKNKYRPYAYGPHTVVRANMCELRNCFGVVFTHMANDILVKGVEEMGDAYEMYGIPIT